MDPTAPTQAKSSFDRFLLGLLNDPRDLDFAHLIVNCSVVAVAGTALFFLGESVWWFAVPYLMLWGLWVVDRYTLMLHCTSHRPLFRKKFRYLNRVVPWVLAPFFGQTPETYFAHHMGMHHPENNMSDDLSSTLRFQRDSFKGWLQYYLRFVLIGAIELPIYFAKRHKRKLCYRTIFGELSWYALVIGAAFMNWRAAIIVFVVPFVVIRFLMMAGNWAQHAFIAADDPENPYTNSLTCVNSRYNRRCFNDGYHIHHHVDARCHWTEYAKEFDNNRERYGREDAVIFEGVDFFIVWAMLMAKRYDALAKRFVRLPGAPERNQSEVVAFLKSRLEPVSVSAPDLLQGGTPATQQAV